jgi:hypothetical protein
MHDAILRAFHAEQEAAKQPGYFSRYLAPDDGDAE